MTKAKAFFICLLYFSLSIYFDFEFPDSIRYLSDFHAIAMLGSFLYCFVIVITIFMSLILRLLHMDWDDLRKMQQDQVRQDLEDEKKFRALKKYLNDKSKWK